MYGLAVIRQNAFLLIAAPPAGEHVQRLQNIKFFTRPDMCANFPDFSCMLRGAKRRLFWEKKKNNSYNIKRASRLSALGP